MDAVASVGQPAPDFSLPDLDGEALSLARAKGRIVVLIFWSAECPWSGRGDEALAESGLDQADDVLVWRVASNVNEDGAQLRNAAEARGVAPVLVDIEHQVADLYGALTTPHVFVVDQTGTLVYGGALNDATWRDPEPSRTYLAEAVQAIRQGTEPELRQTPGRGCTIVRHLPGTDRSGGQEV